MSARAEIETAVAKPNRTALPVTAVAERLDLTAGTVKKQLARGRAKLREELS